MFDPKRLPSGLYVITRLVRGKPLGVHWAILDIGGWLGYSAPPWYEPMVMHLTHDGVRVEQMVTPEEWEVVSRIEDKAGAVRRVRSVVHGQTYFLLTNNCEHFTNYIARGSQYSSQVLAASLACAALAVVRLAA